jgi:glycosyltransferase involved in cell wall biosynthesis
MQGIRLRSGTQLAHQLRIRMKIALLSTCAVPVPPLAYGGTELVIAALAKALVSRGHDVTVYATGDSKPAGSLKYHFEASVWPPNPEAEKRHAEWAWRELRLSVPDIVHVNSPEALEAWDGIGAPPFLTIHHEREEHLVRLYKRFPHARFVAISRRQAELLPELGSLPVVHHGVNTELYPAGVGGGGYCAFLGRIAPEKAPHLAIDAARKAGMPLVMGAPHWNGDPVYEEFYAREMAPRISWRGLQWPGELDMPSKLAMLQRAEALLMPMGWDEPFGLVMIEAMLVGTPVIAFPRGSAPEIVEDGVTGYLVHDTNAMVAAIPTARRIDRKRCRRRALQRFSAARMAADYERLYEEARLPADLNEAAI